MALQATDEERRDGRHLGRRQRAATSATLERAGRRDLARARSARRAADAEARRRRADRAGITVSPRRYASLGCPSSSSSPISRPRATSPRRSPRWSTGVERGDRFQTLLGITGSGKSFTIANVIAKAQRPTLVLAPNKSLAAQLAAEFRELFPKNRVEYFVSYYDYYQPEAYLPSTDTYIEKDSSINDEIDRLRHSATSALLTRRDVIIVASVSAIYGLGSPEMYAQAAADARAWARSATSARSCAGSSSCSTSATTSAFARNKFRVRGDTIEVFPAYEERAVRIQLFGDEVERIASVDPLTGEIVEELDTLVLFPASHYVTDEERHASRRSRASRPSSSSGSRELEEHGKLLEAQRLRMRTTYDLEMLREVGMLLRHRELLDAPRRPRAPASRRTRCSTTSPTTGSCVARRVARRRSRSCTASSRATGRARTRSSSTASGCRRRWTTGRCGSRSSSSG